MRGYQKRVIYMKNPGSSFFEEAYFVIKDGNENSVSSPDIIEEANRIIKENIKEKREIKRASSLFAFGMPFLLGSVIATLVLSLIFYLI